LGLGHLAGEEELPPLYAHDPFLAIQAALCRPWLDGFMCAASTICEGWMLAPLAFAAVFAMDRRVGRATVTLLAVALGLVVTGATVQLLKHAIPEPRPLAVLGNDSVRVLMEPLYAYAFPSGHSAAASSSAAIMTFRFGRRAWPFWVLALLGGLSRIYVGAHWTLDVLGGLFTGVLVATFLELFFRAIRCAASAVRTLYSLSGVVELT
jgi:membrane-associated phospholipid phosphatase